MTLPIYVCGHPGCSASYPAADWCPNGHGADTWALKPHRSLGMCGDPTRVSGHVWMRPIGTPVKRGEPCDCGSVVWPEAVPSTIGLSLRGAPADPQILREPLQVPTMWIKPRGCMRVTTLDGRYWTCLQDLGHPGPCDGPTAADRAAASLEPAKVPVPTGRPSDRAQWPQLDLRVECGKLRDRLDRNARSTTPLDRLVVDADVLNGLVNAVAEMHNAKQAQVPHDRSKT